MFVAIFIAQGTPSTNLMYEPEKDASMIINYLAEFISLSSDEIAVADVNGDGNVTISDASYIQAKVATYIDEFPNGAFVYLDS